MYRLSLIVATINRFSELGKLFSSLNNQSFEDFEIVLVDQNEGDLLSEIVRKYQDSLNIKHIRSEPGLSKARNVGILHATGEIFSFPDDDCCYPYNLLEYVNEAFNSEIDGLVGKQIYQNRNRVKIKPCLEKDETTMYSIWDGRAKSINLFIRSKTINTVGGFDEKLGVGSDTIYQSGEETDLIIRILKKGYSLFHDENIKVYHPDDSSVDNKGYLKKSYYRGIGHGYILRKNNVTFFIILKRLLKPILGILVFNFIRIKKSRFYKYSFLGRLRGLIDGK